MSAIYIIYIQLFSFSFSLSLNPSLSFSLFSGGLLVLLHPVHVPALMR